MDNTSGARCNTILLQPGSRLEQEAIGIAPRPVLAGLEASDQRVA
jgi:hypothetical protein